MSDARWLEVEDDVAAAVQHFTRSIELFEAGGFDADTLDGYRSRMAFMHAMQSAHTLMESALVRILSMLAETLPSGPDWHHDLIRRTARPVNGRPALLTLQLADAAHETRRFRPVAMRSYGSFDATKADPAVEAARKLASGLSSTVASFRQVVDR